MSSKTKKTKRTSGVIYRYVLKKKGDPDYGKSYIGETTDEKTRRQNWKKANNKSYASSKLNKAQM